MMDQSTAQDYSDGCAAGRSAAAIVINSVRTDTDNLPHLVWALRAAAADANSADLGIKGHGIGFLFAVAETTISEEKFHW